jgi:hypothetical protein
VTEDEYREIILPGSVRPGEPPRRFVDDWVSFLWGSVDERSRHYEHLLLASYGGKPFTLREASFSGGERQYAAYRAHRKLRLEVSDDAGNPFTIETGSVVAEVDGRFKFISFTSD